MSCATITTRANCAAYQMRDRRDPSTWSSRSSRRGWQVNQQRRGVGALARLCWRWQRASWACISSWPKCRKRVQAIEVLHQRGFRDLSAAGHFAVERPRVSDPADPTGMRPCVDERSVGHPAALLNTVPRLAQLAEGLPHMHHSGTVRGYVLEDQRNCGLPGNPARAGRRVVQCSFTRSAEAVRGRSSRRDWPC